MTLTPTELTFAPVIATLYSKIKEIVEATNAFNIKNSGPILPNPSFVPPPPMFGGYATNTPPYWLQYDPGFNLNAWPDSPDSPPVPRTSLKDSIAFGPQLTNSLRTALSQIFPENRLEFPIYQQPSLTGTFSGVLVRFDRISFTPEGKAYLHIEEESGMNSTYQIGYLGNDGLIKDQEHNSAYLDFRTALHHTEAVDWTKTRIDVQVGRYGHLMGLRLVQPTIFKMV